MGDAWVATDPNPIALALALTLTLTLTPTSYNGGDGLPLTLALTPAVTLIGVPSNRDPAKPVITLTHSPSSNPI